MTSVKESSMLTEMERKVIEESVLKRLKERYPGAKGGRILSKIKGFMGHVHEGKVKIVYAPGIYKKGEDGEEVYY
jgi:hypothetical protein